MRKYLSIYEGAVSHIWLCNRSLLNFLIYEGNFIFFFISAVRGVSTLQLLNSVQSPNTQSEKQWATAWKILNFADLALYCHCTAEKRGLKDFVEIQNLTRIRWIMSFFFDASAWLVHIQQLHKIRNTKIKRSVSQQPGYLLNTQKLSCTKSEK